MIKCLCDVCLCDDGGGGASGAAGWRGCAGGSVLGRTVQLVQALKNGRFKLYD